MPTVSIQVCHFIGIPKSHTEHILVLNKTYSTTTHDIQPYFQQAITQQTLLSIHM